MAIYTFNVDVYPYCKGDTVNLNKKQKALVDETAKIRNLEDVYVVADDGKKAEAEAKAQAAAEAKAKAAEEKAAEAEAKAKAEAEAKAAKEKAQEEAKK